MFSNIRLLSWNFHNILRQNLIKKFEHRLHTQRIKNLNITFSRRTISTLEIKPLTILAKETHRWCSTRFWIRLCVIIFFFSRVFSGYIMVEWSCLSAMNLIPLRTNLTKWSNTLKQFVGCCRRIVWVCLTILWGWRLKCHVIKNSGMKGIKIFPIFPISRSSHQRCSVRKVVLRNFAKITGKHLCQSPFLTSSKW